MPEPIKKGDEERHIRVKDTNIYEGRDDERRDAVGYLVTEIETT